MKLIHDEISSCFILISLILLKERNTMLSHLFSRWKWSIKDMFFVTNGGSFWGGMIFCRSMVTFFHNFNFLNWKHLQSLQKTDPDVEADSHFLWSYGRGRIALSWKAFYNISLFYKKIFLLHYSTVEEINLLLKQLSRIQQFHNIFNINGSYYYYKQIIGFTISPNIRLIS